MCVWPGSHHKIHPWTRSPDGAVQRGNGGFTNADGPLPDLGPPTQLLLSAGDVVLAHSALAHCGAGPHGQSAPLAGPALGSCATLGLAWQLRLAAALPEERPARWAPSHGLGCSSEPPPKPSISPPLTMQAGHLGSEIRSMLYFRVRHTGWKEMVEQEAGALTQDMWCDLEGVASYIS
jgi:hypothetical protein